MATWTLTAVGAWQQSQKDHRDHVYLAGKFYVYSRSDDLRSFQFEGDKVTFTAWLKARP